MLEDLEASFLTFHSPSTQATNSSKDRGIVDSSSKISMPVFSLASFKPRGSILSPREPCECKQEGLLWQAAESWLQHLHVGILIRHPDARDVEASFLTFHSLSTHAANSSKDHGTVHSSSKISLPVFGAAWFKLRGSILSPSEPHECEQEGSVWQAAESWLQQVACWSPRSLPLTEMMGPGSFLVCPNFLIVGTSCAKIVQTLCSVV
ncbi:Hypothetical predicted protein [Olea europaea subsp. europaea]|uniref:Uncharacterized protein n=1 Tax=Olea europaea subsp. europaea TaxID=158383 RepID=A0A8S0QGR8_OLEEU|nr:Hypothetical predicted protein [Olea europaea subsp. europaea]